MRALGGHALGRVSASRRMEGFCAKKGLASYGTFEKPIKLYSLLAMLSLLLSYAVGPNLRVHVVSSPVVGLSNELALAVCSALVAGGFVALLVEISRWAFSKKLIVERIFISVVGARRSSRIARYVLDDVADDISTTPNNFVELVSGLIDGQLVAIFFSGYDSFLSCGELDGSWRGFI